MKRFQNFLFILFLISGDSTAAQNYINADDKEIAALLDSADTYSLKDPERCLQIANEILTRLGTEEKSEFRVRALLHSSNSYKMLSRKEEALRDASIAL